MNIGQLIQATRNAKARTGRNGIGTAADKGGLVVVEVSYNDKGKSTVTKLSDALPMEKAIAFLDAL